MPTRRNAACLLVTAETTPRAHVQVEQTAHDGRSFEKHAQVPPYHTGFPLNCRFRGWVPLDGHAGRTWRLPLRRCSRRIVAAVVVWWRRRRADFPSTVRVVGRCVVCASCSHGVEGRGGKPAQRES